MKLKMETETNNKHRGWQVRRFRESIGMKQEALAVELDTNTREISYLEMQRDIDDKIFSRLAKRMGVKPEMLKRFSVEEGINIYSNSFQGHSMLNGVLYNPVFYPVDKIMEQFSKIEDMYERLLQSEREKVEILSRANELMTKTMEMMKRTK